MMTENQAGDCESAEIMVTGRASMQKEVEDKSQEMKVIRQSNAEVAFMEVDAKIEKMEEEIKADIKSKEAKIEQIEEEIKKEKEKIEKEGEKIEMEKEKIEKLIEKIEKVDL